MGELGIELIPSSSPQARGLKEARTVRNDNCVSYQGKLLQIPPQRHRIQYVRAEVEVREYEDGRLAVFHDQLRLGLYAPDGRLDEACGPAREAA